MSTSSDSTGFTHSVQKFLLVIPGVFPGKFNLDVDGTTVRYPVSPDISLAVVSHVYDSAVLGVELTYRVVPGDAAVLTEGYDDLVL